MKLDEKLIDSAPIMSYGGEGSENKETSSHDDRQEGLFHLITHSPNHSHNHSLTRLFTSLYNLHYLLL